MRCQSVFTRRLGKIVSHTLYNICINNTPMEFPSSGFASGVDNSSVTRVSGGVALNGNLRTSAHIGKTRWLGRLFRTLFIFSDIFKTYRASVTSDDFRSNPNGGAAITADSKTPEGIYGKKERMWSADIVSTSYHEGKRHMRSNRKPYAEERHSESPSAVSPQPATTTNATLRRRTQGSQIDGV